MKPRLFRSLWKKLLSQKEVPEPCPGCCAWSHTSSVSAPLPGGTGSKDLFLFALGEKGNFFDDRRVIFPSSPSDNWLKLLSLQRCLGFPFNPILTLHDCPTASGEKSSEHSTQEAPEVEPAAWEGLMAWSQGVVSHRWAACGAHQHAWNRHADRLEIPPWFHGFSPNSLGHN